MRFVSIIATTAPERAVWLSFGFYLLNLLIPIIPAVIIYRLFPEGKTKNSVEGSVAGWRIKAVGAWGAYVTAFVLGYWAINSTSIPLIKAVGGASVWTIESEFQLVDKQGTEINDTVEKLQLEPPMIKPWGKRATIKVFSETLDPPEKLRLKLEGYDYITVDLNPAMAKDGKITIPTIKLIKLPSALKPEVPLQPPLPPGTGPPALTSAP